MSVDQTAVKSRKVSKAPKAEKAPKAPREKRMHFSLERQRSIFGYIFTLPFLIGFCVFMAYPLFKNLTFSFGKITETVGLKTTFVGWKNYIELFTKDIDFLPAFWDTLQATFLWTPFIIVFALFLAIMLNRNIKGKGVFRVIFFLPVLLGTGFIMQSVSGVANILAMPEVVGDFISEYFSEGIAEFIGDLIAAILSMFWSTGVQIVIFLSGLQGIPDSYYEAARVDNANAWDCLWKITLPLMSPTILLNVIYTIVESFSSTDNKIASLIIGHVFDNARFEYAAAMGWVFFVVVLLVVGLIFLVSRKVVNYEK